MSIPFSLSHDDHGISDSQLSYIHTEVVSTEPTGFFIKEVILPEYLGSVENALYGPSEGDEPVSEQEVVYIARGDRAWKDRMVKRPMRQTQKVQAIGIVNYDEDEAVTHISYFTIHGGSLAPQNPEDPSNRDVEGAKKFWSEHALVLQ